MRGISYKDYDGLGLAELVRKKETYSKELIEEVITTIGSLTPYLNTIIHIY